MKTISGRSQTAVVVPGIGRPRKAKTCQKARRHKQAISYSPRQFAKVQNENKPRKGERHPQSATRAQLKKTNKETTKHHTKPHT